MGLIGEVYRIYCDVQGCTNECRDSLHRISNKGWKARRVYDGVPRADLLTTDPSAHICPECVKSGAVKTMIKAGG